MPVVIIPENCYAILEKNQHALLPNMIFCMGCSIVLNNGKKVVLHLADLPGFPLASRVVDNLKHPLPREYHAFGKKASKVFQFLLSELKATFDDVTQVSIFGNYRSRADVFSPNNPADFLKDSFILDVISHIFKIDPKQVDFLPMKYVDFQINDKGEVSRVLSEGQLIRKIALENLSFYRQHLALDPDNFHSHHLGPK